MEKYRHFSVEDFVQDEFFHKWVKYPFSPEAEWWENWLAENPEMTDVVEESKSIIHSFHYQSQHPGDDFYLNLKNRIDASLTNKQKSSFFIPVWMRTAAIVTGLIVTAGIFFYSHSDNSFTTFNSKYAETKKVILPDGSEVVLNANSVLKFHQTREGREVWLKGEGFFSIRHIEDDDKHPTPMIVHAGEVAVNVIGTQFNIDANDSEKTEVLLTKGKVRLSVDDPSNSPVNMASNELALYDNKTKGLSVNRVSAENYIAWMDHKYIFEKVTVEDLGKEIYHYYGKPVIIRDLKIRKQRLSGTLELQDEGTLIRTLSVLLGVRVKKAGEHIFIGS